MLHSPIFIKNLSLSFLNKICFEDFSTVIYPQSRIGIIGRNGCGKSNLLKIITGELAPSQGEISNIVSIAYVPQLPEDHSQCSGSERFNKSLSQAIAKHPDVLCLDEPTNHLDSANRKSLMRMLQKFSGSLLIATHDVDLLSQCTNIIWHIENNKVNVFTGNYKDYIQTNQQQKAYLQQEKDLLKKQEKEAHIALMKEQKRAKNSKQKGYKSISNRKWPTIVSNAKATRGEQTSGKKKKQIAKQQQVLTDSLNQLYIPEVITPKFFFEIGNKVKTNPISIKEGSLGYESEIIKDINLLILSGEKISINGKNASGKSTFAKALLNDLKVNKAGDWKLPSQKYFGYLDQHYSNINEEKNAFELIKNCHPLWNEQQIRNHLNDFLFRKNYEVYNKVKNLSGGEKCRLSLAVIAAKAPQILILDEITNNIDLETKEHVINVLNQYSGNLIVISHDQYFLDSLHLDKKYLIAQKRILEQYD